MKLIKIKANSIHSALAEARREYGNDVMLIESQPADENSLAEIIIGIDSPGSSTRQVGMGKPQLKRPDSDLSRRTQIRPTFSPRNVTVETLRSDSFREQLSAQMIPEAADAARELADAFASHRPQLPGTMDDPQPSRPDHATSSDRIGLDRSAADSKRRPLAPRLKDAAGKLAERLVGDRSLRSIADDIVSRTTGRIANEMELPGDHNTMPLVPSREPESINSISTRLRSIEKSLSGSSIAFANRWISHPLYSEMTTKGYSAETAIAVLSTLASRGVPPNADLGYLRARVFEEMRRRNRTVIANTRTGRHVFVGTCGSGKTNLILKIANDTSTRASGRTIVLTLGEPSSSTAAATTAYAQAGVESLHIHSAQQLSYSLEVLARYETVLIDVPSLSCSPETCDLQVRQIAATLEPLDLLTIHYVIDVRRNLDDVSEDIGSCGLAVDALALTNLDGLKRPGLLIDFLARHERPVFFASSSRYQSGSGLDRFVPADLIANSLGLDEWPYSENELNDYFQTASTRTSNRSMDFGDSIALRPMGVNGRI